MITWASLGRFVVCWLVASHSQQQASVSQCLTDLLDRQSLRAATLRHKLQTGMTSLPHPVMYTDTGPTSPSADPITPGAWQG